MRGFYLFGKRAARFVFVVVVNVNTGKYVVVLTFGVAKVSIDFVDVFRTGLWVIGVDGVDVHVGLRGSNIFAAAEGGPGGRHGNGWCRTDVGGSFLRTGFFGTARIGDITQSGAFAGVRGTCGVSGRHCWW